MLTKRYLSNDTICKVTFYLPESAEVRTAYVVGDFNQWDKSATPMEQLKDGRWKAELKLDAGKEYQFRYFINGSQWLNDDEADGFVAHPYGGENSVVRA
jgi:1,4-alpha-glucan branching enzyme